MKQKTEYRVALADLQERVRQLHAAGFYHDTCYYCGDAAFGGGDHPVPHSFLHKKGTARKWGEHVVPCCMECNSLLSSRITETMLERIEFLSARVAERNRKLLSAPSWTSEDVAELGFGLQTAVRLLAVEQILTRARLKNLSRKHDRPAIPITGNVKIKQPIRNESVLAPGCCVCTAWSIPKPMPPELSRKTVHRTKKSG